MAVTERFLRNEQYQNYCTGSVATQKRAHRLSVIPIYYFVRCLHHHHLSLSVFLGWVLLPDDIIQSLRNTIIL